MSGILLAVILGASGGAIALPNGDGGIGFDDMGFSAELGKVVVPAGRTGSVDLIDPASHRVEAVGGLSTTSGFHGGHGAGATSADVAGGLLFASDRDRKVVVVVELATRKVLVTQPLAGSPDYVRHVAPTDEVWVTEPSRKSIEIFHLQRQPALALTHVADVAIEDGPESLVVDVQRKRAYTHSWHGTTYAIDLGKHQVAARWKNGCQGARGIALDGARGQLFVGCEEGRAAVLDVDHDGKLLGEAKAGAGVDIIAYAPQQRRLFVPGGDAQTLTVFQVSEAGALTKLGTAETAEDAHCVAADAQGVAYVCDPKTGRILVIAPSELAK